MKRFYSILLLIISLIVSVSCINQNKEKNEKQKLIIFHAGSLSVPFKQMKEAFEKQNPNTEVLLESAGSVQCARKITDLKKDCDIIASADYSIIDKMLIPKYASWNIQFATNEMSIVYNDDSKYAGEINATNWYKILLRDDVIIGRSDPNSDPCGYRAILTSELAEKYYNYPELSEKIEIKDQEYIRPKEVDLIALLESKAIDYIFLYRSVANQHNLNYIILPDSINLKNPDLNNYYQKAHIDITGKEPGSIITQKGQAMVYGITILKNAPNKRLAEKFIDFLLSKNGGQKIMKNNGQPAFFKVDKEYITRIPENLKKYIKP